MMNFEGFKQDMVDKIKDYLPKEFQDAIVEINRIEKVGKSYDGLVVRKEGTQVVASIDLNQCYSHYEKTGDFEDVINQVASVVINEQASMGNMDFNWVFNYEEAKNHLYISVDNIDNFKKLSEKVPYKKMEDFVITARIDIPIPGREGAGSILVSNNLIEKYGISEEKLFEDAIENSAKIHPIKIFTMKDLMIEQGMSSEVADELFGEAPDIMTAVSTQNYCCGASAIFYPGVMEELSEKLGGDFIVIPSSIHETLVVPYTHAMEKNEIENLIKQVNDNEVRPEDRLSYKAFRYDSIDGELRCMEQVTEYGIDNKVYISLDKSYCYQMDDKFVPGKKFNVMKMPNGTVLNGKDISGGKIKPIFMSENKYNQNEMTATYYLPDDNELMIRLSLPNGTQESVNVKDLKLAVDAQKYAEKQAAKEKEVAKENTKSVKKEKSKSVKKEKSKQKDDSAEL